MAIIPFRPHIHYRTCVHIIPCLQPDDQFFGPQFARLACATHLDGMYLMTPPGREDNATVNTTMDAWSQEDTPKYYDIYRLAALVSKLD